MTSQRRKHYRLVYPLPGRPALFVGNEKGEEEHVLTELSESGGRVLATTANELVFQSSPAVTIKFRDGKQAMTAASYLRTEGEELVLKFSPTIPLSIMMEQQRWILSRFPKDPLRKND